MIWIHTHTPQRSRSNIIQNLYSVKNYTAILSRSSFRGFMNFKKFAFLLLLLYSILFMMISHKIKFSFRLYHFASLLQISLVNLEIFTFSFGSLYTAHIYLDISSHFICFCWDGNEFLTHNNFGRTYHLVRYEKKERKTAGCRVI